MSTQNQNNKLMGPNAKQYSKNANQEALRQAKQYAAELQNNRAAMGLSKEERARQSSINLEESQIINEEIARVRRAEERNRKSRKRRKLRPQAVALLTAVGLGGVAIGAFGPKVIKGFETIGKNHTSSQTMDIEAPTTQLPNSNESVPEVEDIETPDEITYVIDFNDYANPDAEITIREMIDSGKVGALIMKAGGTGYDYPFAIRNFDEEEIINDMAPYSGEVSLSGNMGQIEDLEKYVQMAIDKDVAVGFYYYTCANTYREADMEAAYIKSFYDKLEKDMPNLNEAKMMPITIDIEDSGPEREGRHLSYEEQEVIKERRTEAVRHLVKDLSENGVVDSSKGVVIYGDINAEGNEKEGIASYYVNWEELYDGIEQDGTKVIQWGTRALPQTYDNGITYTNTSFMISDLMNDQTNLGYMKNAYVNRENNLREKAIMQIHLDKEITNGQNWNQLYDISQTSKETLQAILEGEDIDYGDGFVSRMESIYNESQPDKTQPDRSQSESVGTTIKRMSYDAEDR